MDQFIRGTVADQMEDYYRAVFHYQEALRFDSTSAFILVALAQDYVLLGNPAEAGGLINRALKARPDYLPALELQSLLFRAMGNLAGARNALRKLTQLAPNNAQYLRQLLAVELSLEAFDAADKLYQRLAEARRRIRPPDPAGTRGLSDFRSNRPGGCAAAETHCRRQHRRGSGVYPGNGLSATGRQRARRGAGP